MFFLLGVVAALSGDAGGLPPSRVLMGTCLGVDGPISVVASANASAKNAELQWDLSVITLQPGTPGSLRKANALVPRTFEGVPATSELSWTELDDATQRLWARDLLVLVTPVAGRPPTSLLPLSMERLNGPCEGAAFVNGAAMGGTRSGSALVLIIPGESIALGALPDGGISTIPLVQTSPGGGRKRKKAVAIDAQSAISVDDRVKLERVDVKVDPITRRTVGGGWRITLLPSRTSGQLTSTAVAFPVDGMALHQVTGGLMLKNGRGEVSGVLTEALP